MPKSKSKNSAYTEVGDSPCKTPERQRADKRKAGKRDGTYKPGKVERTSSEGCGLDEVEEKKIEKEVQREVCALLDIHKKVKHDARYKPTKSELQDDASYDHADSMETSKQERKTEKAVRRDLFAVLGKHKKAPPRDLRYKPTQEEEEQDLEDEQEDVKLQSRMCGRKKTPVTNEKKKAIKKALAEKEKNQSLLDGHDGDEDEVTMDDESIDDPSLPQPQQGMATPVKG